MIASVFFQKFRISLTSFGGFRIDLTPSFYYLHCHSMAGNFGESGSITDPGMGFFMINLLIVDSSAESRKQIVDEVNSCFLIDSSHLHFLPRISLKPVSPEELHFAAVPDICIVGPTILMRDMNELGRIRRQFPKSAILVKSNHTLESISMIEHLARLGADDILAESTPPIELLRKLVLHARNGVRSKSGTLITVDSGKGGLGVTSVAAAFAELSVSLGKRTVLIDFDSETQDLSRFLQVRPFINENLNTLLLQQKPMVQELVEECFYQVWADEEHLFCVPPAPDFDAVDDTRYSIYRILISFFETLDSLFDVVIVDRGSAQGLLRKTLHRISDHLIVVHGNDPGSLYATAEMARCAYASMSPASRMWLMQNNPVKHGLPRLLLQQELSRSTRLQTENFIRSIVPFSAAAASWPGSGGTLLSRGGRTGKRALRLAAVEAGLFSSDRQPLEESLVCRILRSLRGRAITEKPKALETERLPSPAHVQDQEFRRKVQRLPGPDDAPSAPVIPRELVGKAQIMQ